MAGDSMILREYLISLGFKVDSAAKQRFGGDLNKWDKAATKLGKSVVGVTLGVQAMATEFAFRMERLYYSSRLAESAAGNLQALDFGGKQAGIKDFTSNVLNLARAVRANPGLQGLLNSLGIPVEGRDKADVMLDLVKALRSMPFYVAQRYAALFGIDPDELLLMEEGLEKIKEAAALRKQVAADLGVDTEAAAKAGLEYAQQWREILMYVGQFKDALTIVMLGPMREMAEVTKLVLADWVKIVQQKDAARGITEKGATQSGLSVAEQRQMAAQLGANAPTGTGKTWSQMTPDEREAQGMGRDSPTRRDWGKLTPEERLRFGMPATEDDIPWYWKMGNAANEAIDNATDYFGIGKGSQTELSSSSKERIGQDRLRSTKTGFGSQLWNRVLDATGYRSIPREQMDAASIEAATAPNVRTGKGGTGAPITSALPAVPEGVADKYAVQEDLMSRLETSKGLPPGLLDYIWNTESRRSTRTDIFGPMTKSGERAEGPFQFMPSTAASRGLTNTQDFGESAKAAASYMADLLKKYNGDLRFALAGYNWGSGNLDQLLKKTMEQHGDWSQQQVDDFVLGHIPKETRDYIAGVGADSGGAQSIEINADTKIEVSGASSPDDVARKIADNQRLVWGDVARQFSAKVR